jgi:hypothetical protein
MQFKKSNNTAETGDPNNEVVETLRQMATSGKNPSATMFWLRCRAGWKPTPENEFAGDDVEMIASSGPEED